VLRRKETPIGPLRLVSNPAIGPAMLSVMLPERGGFPRINRVSAGGKPSGER